MRAAEAPASSRRPSRCSSRTVPTRACWTSRARHRIEAVCVDPRDHPGREAHEKQVIAVLDERAVGLVCLAGYMRILSGSFVKHFEGRLLNIHPSLLPAFPGLRAQRQALQHGVKVAGATVHFVDEGMDTGPIVLQAAVPVAADDTEETLAGASWPKSTASIPRRSACLPRDDSTSKAAESGSRRDMRSSDARARQRARQDGSGGVRARARGPRAWRSCRRAGRRGCSASSGVPVVDVAQVTGFPEMLDGRVKTLHPNIHGGILARRDRPEHMAALETHGIGGIDLVAVTLYPFEATVAKPGVTLEEAIENIDIGGPEHDPGRGEESRERRRRHGHRASTLPCSRSCARDGGSLSSETRYRLAFEAFRRTAQYDAAIAAYLREPGATGRRAERGGRRREPLSRAAAPRRLARRGPPLRREPAPGRGVLSTRRSGLWLERGAMQLHGPELGYNNLLDWSAALGLLLEFDDPAAVVIKHTNPCGVAIAPDGGRGDAEGQGLGSGVHLRRHRRASTGRSTWKSSRSCPASCWRSSSLRPTNRTPWKSSGGPRRNAASSSFPARGRNIRPRATRRAASSADCCSRTRMSSTSTRPRSASCPSARPPLTR